MGNQPRWMPTGESSTLSSRSPSNGIDAWRVLFCFWGGIFFFQRWQVAVFFFPTVFYFLFLKLNGFLVFFLKLNSFLGFVVLFFFVFKVFFWVPVTLSLGRIISIESECHGPRSKQKPENQSLENMYTGQTHWKKTQGTTMAQDNARKRTRPPSEKASNLLHGNV